MKYKKTIEVENSAPVYSRMIADTLNKRNMTQADLASKCPNVSEATLTAWIQGDKNGRRTEPKVGGIVEVAKALNVSTDYLLGLTKDPTTDTDLKAVCDYTGLSQAAIEQILRTQDSGKETLSRVMESDSFRYMVRILDDASLNTDYLAPSGERIAKMFMDKLGGNGVDFAYQKALQLIGLYGIEPVFKQELTEEALSLFDEVVKGEKNENP